MKFPFLASPSSVANVSCFFQTNYCIQFAAIKKKVKFEKNLILSKTNSSNMFYSTVFPSIYMHVYCSLKRILNNDSLKIYVFSVKIVDPRSYTLNNFLQELMIFKHAVL